MRIAFIIYEDMTALDFVGVYDPLTRLKTMGLVPDLKWDICAHTPKVKDHTGLVFSPTKVKESLHAYDMIVVPGGFGSRKLMHDIDFIGWLKTAKGCGLKTSVCTGSLLLGAAGFLTGKKATTHPNALENLRGFCRSAVGERIVEDGDVITAAGVTASIDLGLYLCKKLAGGEVRQRIGRQMDWPHGQC
jgi:transcriptional regulator GlxA family with amidase domain